MRTGQLWYALDDLAVAVEVTGLEVPRSRVEGFLMRLGMANSHYRKLAERERDVGR